MRRLRAMRQFNRIGRICLLFAAAYATSAITAGAQIRGVYSPGSNLSGAGGVPDPGFSYSNQFWYNTADRWYTPDGKPRPDQNNIFALIDNNTFTLVPKSKLWGAKLELMVDVAISKGSFAAIDSSQVITSTGFATLEQQPYAVSAVGFTNINFVPFDLGWSFKRLDLQLGASIYAFSGRYTPLASDNLSSGCWTFGPQVGATIYLTRSKSNQVSVYDYYAWNTQEARRPPAKPPRDGGPVTPGQNESIDYSVSHTFVLGKEEKWSLLAGPAGYGQWQTTINQRPDSQGLKYTIQAVGFTVNVSTPYKGVYFGTSQLWEYDAHDTYEGRTRIVTGGVNF